MDRMEKFIKQKQESKTSMYSMKKAFKGIIGSKMNELEDMQKLKKQFVENLTLEERKQLKDELKESKYQQYLENKEKNVTHDIASR